MRAHRSAVWTEITSKISLEASSRSCLNTGGREMACVWALLPSSRWFGHDRYGWFLDGHTANNQVIWGKPKLVIRFSHQEVEELHVLRCEVLNVPIVKRLLRILQVQRATAEDVIARFEICDAHSKANIFAAVPEINTYNHQVQRVSLPASHVPGRLADSHTGGNSRRPANATLRGLGSTSPRSGTVASTSSGSCPGGAS